jgi:hypothetical protein
MSSFSYQIFSINPVRNSNGVLNPAGIILGLNPAAEQRGIISNGVKSLIIMKGRALDVNIKILYGKMGSSSGGPFDHNFYLEFREESP